jgi:hypothetical protein
MMHVRMFAFHVDNEKKEEGPVFFFLFLFTFSFFFENYSKAMAYKKERIRVYERVVVVALMTKHEKNICL